MIGQTDIKNRISKIDDLYHLPKSIIISGKKGSGRHTVLDFICQKFCIEFETIDYELSLDILNDMYGVSIPKLYVIDFDKLGENKRLDRFQNTLLKFIEEPPQLAWIILIVRDSSFLLETVKNRCVEFRLSEYSLSELRELSELYDKDFTDDDLRLLGTPYNIINKSKDDIRNICSLVYNVVENINRASISNVLTIRNKFENGLDLQLFIIAMLDVLYQKYSMCCDQKYFAGYVLTSTFQNNLNVLGINKDTLMDNYLLQLKELLDD